MRNKGIDYDYLEYLEEKLGVTIDLSPAGSGGAGNLASLVPQPTVQPAAQPAVQPSTMLPSDQPLGFGAAANVGQEVRPDRADYDQFEVEDRLAYDGRSDD